MEDDLRFHEEGGSFFPDFSSFLSPSSADHLLEDQEALFSAQYFCTNTCSASSFFEDDLGDPSNVDFTSFWAQMEENDAHRKRNEGDCEKAMTKVAEIRGRRGGVSTEKKALTFELVSQHFSMPIKQAARELNVGVTVLKKQCRKLGIPRWPHRKVKSLQTLIDNVQELGKGTAREDRDLTRSVVEILMQTKKMIEERPGVMLDEMTKDLRQAFFKENFKRRRLMGHGIW